LQTVVSAMVRKLVMIVGSGMGLGIDDHRRLFRRSASSSVTPPSRPTGPPPRRVVYGEGHSRPAQPRGNFDLP
jgi:hypothetical protein